MKRVVALVFVLFMFLSLKAQIFVDGVPLKQTDKYLTLILEQRINISSLLSYNYVVYVELQDKSGKYAKWKHLTDEKGKNMRFATVNSAIIYFEDNGYELKDFGATDAKDGMRHILLLFEQNKVDLTTEENNGK